MRSLKSLIMGIVAGMVLSTLSLIIPYAGHLLVVGRPGLPTAVVISGLAGGIIAGAAGMALARLTSGRERAVLVLLISTAVASLAVYLGRYANGSLVPPAIYGLALGNGLLIARVTAGLCARHNLHNHRGLAR